MVKTMKDIKPNGTILNNVQASIIIITDAFNGKDEPHQLVISRHEKGFTLIAASLSTGVDHALSDKTDVYSNPYGEMLRLTNYALPVTELKRLSNSSFNGMVVFNMSSSSMREASQSYQRESVFNLNAISDDISDKYQDPYFYDSEHQEFIQDVLRRACALGVIDSFDEPVCRPEDVAPRMVAAGMNEAWAYSSERNGFKNLVANVQKAQALNAKRSTPFTY